MGDIEIIGYQAEKDRIEGIADVFVNREKYSEKGVNIPKGLLLSGPAGVGKTMFATYLAKLAGATFLQFNPALGKGSQTENAQKLKMLFEEAKTKTPAIIFVDEIDNYLPQNDVFSDRKSDFLSALLKALDGEGYQDILFIGACVDNDCLPFPLLRSGRLDEQIVFTYPDCATRKKMIEYYYSLTKMKVDFDYKALAYKTAGFVGADIKNLVNMSSRIAVRRNQDTISFDDILESIYTIKYKDIRRKNHGDEKYEIAVHEVGHLVVGKVLMSQSYDVTIDGYDYIKGITSPSYDDDNDDDDDWATSSENKETLNNEIAVSLAGKAATEMFLDKHIGGCYSDIKKSQSIIDYMLSSGLYGFKYIDIGDTSDRGYWSNRQKRLNEKKTLVILNNNYKIAKRILRRNKELVMRLVDELIDRTVLISEESDKIFKEYGF